MSPLRLAHVTASDAVEAVSRFEAAVRQPDTALVMFFCSRNFDRDILAEQMRHRFPGIVLVGCTTAGEIGPAGYLENSLSGLSLPASHFTVACSHIGNLQEFDTAQGQAAVRALLQDLEGGGDQDARGPRKHRFAFMMIDGLSVGEEQVTRAVQLALGAVPLVGGSAGDGLEFSSTWVYANGRFHADSAVLLLAATDLPVKPLMAQHFVASDRRVVVTSADAARRIVHEIDGLPAAQVYADMLGLAASDLSPRHFAGSPLAVRIAGINYVRSISKALPDGSLKFFCAIEEGMVLRLTHGSNLLAGLSTAFRQLRTEIGPPAAVIACDCVLRRIEITEGQATAPIAELMAANRVVGFNSYGEQFHGVHVNQTFTGIAIGEAAPGRD